MTEKVLMIGFQLPPAARGSGRLRILGFARHLPSFGWDPVLLSANMGAYPQADPASMGLLPDGMSVYRAFALDAKRHLGIRGRYSSLLAQPDRWWSWWPGAVLLGLRLVRRHRVRAIWSTYPIMTAHCVAGTLARLTGIPWIADFRDPVGSSGAPQGRFTPSLQMRCERRVIERATCCVFTTPGTQNSYAQHYPCAEREGRLKVVPNGFDEADFTDLPGYRPPVDGRPLHLVHSGVLYEHGRNPGPFLEALAQLRDEGVLNARSLRVTLRASGSEATYQAEIKRLALDDIVTLAPSVPYHEALAEQTLADGLLLFQGDIYDRQIPAKAYEYLRVGRPILALAGGAGDTARLLLEAGGATVVPPDNVCRIRQGLARFLESLSGEQATSKPHVDVSRWSRRHGASGLANLLDSAVAEHGRV